MTINNKLLVVWQNWGLGSQSGIEFFSLLIIYLEGPGRCFQVGVDLPPLSILRNSFLMIEIDVHFWNEYVPCQ